MDSNNLPNRPGMVKSVLPFGFSYLLTGNVIIGRKWHHQFGKAVNVLQVRIAGRNKFRASPMRGISLSVQQLAADFLPKPYRFHCELSRLPDNKYNNQIKKPNYKSNWALTLFINNNNQNRLQAITI
ncbi:hypothetical protein [Xenorhabdus santafensis]|uniref:hypothetical protein n=1 Tax=Xenorhabdus santafensis TaxID=2582833 RepID=UPI003F6A91B0